MEHTWKIHGKYMENTWNASQNACSKASRPQTNGWATSPHVDMKGAWRCRRATRLSEKQLYGPIEIVDCPIKMVISLWFNPSFFRCLPFRVGPMTLRRSYDFWPAAYPSSGPAGGPGGRAAPVKGGFFSRILETICGRGSFQSHGGKRVNP